MPQVQYADKVVDAPVAMQRQVTTTQTEQKMGSLEEKAMTKDMFDERLAGSAASCDELEALVAFRAQLKPVGGLGGVAEHLNGGAGWLVHSRRQFPGRYLHQTGERENL